MMISISNKNAILFHSFLWIILLLLATAAVLYFYYSIILLICAFLLTVISFIRLAFSRYSEITTYNEYIAVKDYLMFGNGTALSFTPIALVDIAEFGINEKKNALVFHTEFDAKVENAGFSLKFFTKKQKSDLETALREIINKSRAA
ncbi:MULTISPECIES: hypothetical protein [unclassified Chryseobacterium]|uniref:hypothetical protein n=1 Tax=unclassified Chryseobacterium TaxID=2593645 RepID=UPI0009113ED7|nr:MULTISPECIES: hypothetical protein [unclassified Chryseobacterium]SHG24017.1 hypothetical protein SAMN02787100_3549 [Chryseobacterium sp. OV279]HCA08926.1 hypothetical protein [Chryseobacterium sp.]